MSTYTKITRHPNTGQWHKATWHDDYFGEHMFGVEFPGDKVIYPVEQVQQAQLKTFWVADVLETLRERGWDDDTIIRFLEKLERTYKARWKRDPAGGEGAVDWLAELRGEDTHA